MNKVISWYDQLTGRENMTVLSTSFDRALTTLGYPTDSTSERSEHAPTSTGTHFEGRPGEDLPTVRKNDREGDRK